MFLSEMLVLAYPIDLRKPRVSSLEWPSRPLARGLWSFTPVEIGRSLLVDSGNARHSHPARLSAPNHLAARGLANLNLTRVISSP